MCYLYLQTCDSLFHTIYYHTFKLVIVCVGLEGLCSDPPGALVGIQSDDGPDHLHHLKLCLVPHGGADVHQRRVVSPDA